MAQIAFLGMGAMGSRMARNLLEAGHSVNVWNRSRDRTRPLEEEGAGVAETPRAAARTADIVMSMLRDDAASENVWCDPEIGALDGMAKGSIAVESSTVSVGWTKELGRRAAGRGVAFADAPVSGSRPQAEGGTLVYLVGADAATFEALEPVLACMGSTIHHCGGNGAGTTIKLAVNMLLGVQGVAMAEALGLAGRAGMDIGTAAEIIGSTPVCSPAAKIAAGMMAREDYSPLFPVDLMEKDFGGIAAAAKDLGAEVPLSEATRKRYREAMEAGLSQENYPAVFRLYRD